VGSAIDPRAGEALDEGLPKQLRLTRERSQRVTGRVLQILQELGIADYINPENSQHLEAVAMGLYRSWFLQFDPVRANLRGETLNGLSPTAQRAFGRELVDSELGPVPASWKIYRLADLADLLMGQSPPSQYYNDDGRG